MIGAGNGSEVTAFTAAHDMNARTAIACATGGFKGAFIHGVLTAFEAQGFRAGAYGAASSSVIPAAFATIGRTRALGLEYWLESVRFISEGGQGMSKLILQGIRKAAPTITEALFLPESPRFLISVSAVDSEGAKKTQGLGARRLGRQLLLAAARGDRGWIDEHLTLHLFDSESCGRWPKLSAANFAEVAYASSRVLHAWDIPAWIDGMAYVDSFYTCSCPAYEAADLGYDHVIAISNEPLLYRDIFQSEIIPSGYPETSIQVIAPDIDPAGLGVSFTTATVDGIRDVYEHGIEKGIAYLEASLEDGFLIEDMR